MTIPRPHPRAADPMPADLQLDARGLTCPLPIIKAKAALRGLARGATLKVVATDPTSVADFAAFARQTGNTLLRSDEENGEFHFLIEKA